MTIQTPPTVSSEVSLFFPSRSRLQSVIASTTYPMEWIPEGDCFLWFVQDYFQLRCCVAVSSFVFTPGRNVEAHSTIYSRAAPCCTVNGADVVISTDCDCTGDTYSVISSTFIEFQTANIIADLILIEATQEVRFAGSTSLSSTGNVEINTPRLVRTSTDQVTITAGNNIVMNSTDMYEIQLDDMSLQGLSIILEATSNTPTSAVGVTGSQTEFIWTDELSIIGASDAGDGVNLSDPLLSPSGAGSVITMTGTSNQGNGIYLLSSQTPTAVRNLNAVGSSQALNGVVMEGQWMVDQSDMDGSCTTSSTSIPCAGIYVTSGSSFNQVTFTASVNSEGNLSSVVYGMYVADAVIDISSIDAFSLASNAIAFGAVNLEIHTSDIQATAFPNTFTSTLVGVNLSGNTIMDSSTITADGFAFPGGVSYTLTAIAHTGSLVLQGDNSWVGDTTAATENTALSVKFSSSTVSGDRLDISALGTKANTNSQAMTTTSTTFTNTHLEIIARSTTHLSAVSTNFRSDYFLLDAEATNSLFFASTVFFSNANGTIAVDSDGLAVPFQFQSTIFPTSPRRDVCSFSVGLKTTIPYVGLFFLPSRALNLYNCVLSFRTGIRWVVAPIISGDVNSHLIVHSRFETTNSDLNLNHLGNTTMPTADSLFSVINGGIIWNLNSHNFLRGNILASQTVSLPDFEAIGDLYTRATLAMTVRSIEDTAGGSNIQVQSNSDSILFTGTVRFFISIPLQIIINFVLF